MLPVTSRAAEDLPGKTASQVAFLQVTGSASESVTLAAGTYSISFDAAQRNFGQSGQTIRVLVDNVPLSSITPTSINYALYTTTTFTVGASAHTIAFLGLNPHGGDNTALIDQVSIVAAVASQPFDPGFEAPSFGAGSSSFAYAPSGSPWTFSGLAGVAGNGSAFTANNPNAPQGGQLAFLQNSGAVSQSVNLAAGTYVLSVDAAQRNFSQAGQVIQVLVDDAPVSTITPTGTSYALYNSTTFTVSAGSHSIKLLGLNPHGGDNTALIDQVFLDWV